MICYSLAIFAVFQFVRKEYVSFSMVFFFLLLEGFQIIPMSLLTYGFFSGTSIDAALVTFIILFFIRGSIWIRHFVVQRSFFFLVVIFWMYSLCNCIYGLLSGYSVSEVFKGLRLYLFLFTPLMFSELPLKQINKIVKILIIIVFAQSVMFLFQLVFGITLLEGVKEQRMDELGYTRYYNIPKLLDFALASSLFWFPLEFSKKARAIFICVFSLTVVAPLHRGYIVSWVLILSFYALVYMPVSKKALFLIGSLFSAAAVATIDVVKIRFLEGFEQLKLVQDVFANKFVYDSNTFIYRVNHFMERLYYVNADPVRWLFGIGLVDEKASKVETLPFTIGLQDSVTGKLVKVYTPDIAWSMLILTLGYLGSILYLSIFLKLMWNYSGRTSVFDGVSKIIFCLILLGIFSSFTSSTLIQPYFFVPILLLVILMEKRTVLRRRFFSINK